MTVLDDRQIDRQLAQWAQVWPRETACGATPGHRTSERPVTRVRPARVGRPGPSGPAVAPLRYAGTGIAVSRAVHVPRRTVSTPVTVALAAVAALITVWLGSIAHFSNDRTSAASVVPEQLAVVRVEAGETLQQLAARVAPDAPAGQIVERIRDLNKLASVAVDAGQTLIAPVG
jgi:hypothetical protein